jgi:hypothetical protein
LLREKLVAHKMYIYFFFFVTSQVPGISVFVPANQGQHQLAADAKFDPFFVSRQQPTGPIDNLHDLTSDLETFRCEYRRQTLVASDNECRCRRPNPFSKSSLYLLRVRRKDQVVRPRSRVSLSWYCRRYGRQRSVVRIRHSIGSLCKSRAIGWSISGC